MSIDDLSTRPHSTFICVSLRPSSSDAPDAPDVGVEDDDDASCFFGGGQSDSGEEKGGGRAPTIRGRWPPFRMVGGSTEPRAASDSKWGKKLTPTEELG